MIEHTVKLTIPCDDGSDDFVVTAIQFEDGCWEVNTNINHKEIDAEDAEQLADFFSRIANA